MNDENHIFIHFKNCHNYSEQKVLKEGFVCIYEFSPQLSCFNCVRYFQEKWENINTLSERYRRNWNAERNIFAYELQMDLNWQNNKTNKDKKEI